jgi:4-diphosphocytidyl-2-C-methyl-D-erythritol kinase
MEITEQAEGVLQIRTPAKVNLLLAVHGLRGDGFHELTSLVAPLDFGDRLMVGAGDADSDSLSCSVPGVPLDETNLVLRAAAAFRKRIGEPVHFKFELEKVIPMGAGLGGGSANAAGALLGMNALLGKPLSNDDLRILAAELGSDCPFFIEPRISLMRGRGEILGDAPGGLVDLLKGERIVLFKPMFGIGTAWAYSALAAARAKYYLSEAEAMERLAAGAEANGVEGLIFNSFEAAVSHKYIAIKTLLDNMRQSGAVCGMSGSGSCCFALPGMGGPLKEDLGAMVRQAWGESVFFIETQLC